MTMFRLAIAVGLLLPPVAEAQTANGSPTAPASAGLIGTPRPISRTAPSVGPTKRVAGKGAPARPAAAVPLNQPLPKPTAAERAEERKLDKDLRICIGC